MAQSDEINKNLIIKFEDQLLSPSDFIDGVREFFSLIKAVTAEICEDSEKVKWVIEVKKGSAIVSFKRHPDQSIPNVENVIKTVHSSFKILETSAEEPESIPEEAYKHLQNLAKIACPDDKTESKISIIRNDEQIKITNQSVKHIREILKDGKQAYGSVEGWLQTVSLREKLHFVLYEPVWDKPIKCWVDKKHLQAMLKLFGKRVEVYGNIRYRKDGAPTSIKVDEVKPFPDGNEIPDFRSVIGLLENK